MFVIHGLIAPDLLQNSVAHIAICFSWFLPFSFIQTQSVERRPQRRGMEQHVGRGLLPVRDPHLSRARSAPRRSCVLDVHVHQPHQEERPPSLQP